MRRRWARFYDGLGRAWSDVRSVVQSLRGKGYPAEALLGALLFAGLWGLSLHQAGPWPTAGGPEFFVMDRVEAVFPLKSLFLHVSALAAFLVLGFLWGALARWAWDLLARFAPRCETGKIRLAVRLPLTLVVLSLLHAAVLARHMARHPALYQESLYRAGGWARGVLTFFAQGGGLIRGALHLFAWAVVLGAAAELGLRLAEQYLSWPRPRRVAWAVVFLFLGFSAAGVWAVSRFHAGRNQGPNLLFIALDSLGSEALRPDAPANFQTPHISALAKGAQYYSACYSPLPEPMVALKTLLSGRSALSHGVRHAFPSQGDLAPSPLDWPAQLKKNGYAGVALADAAGGFFSSQEEAFDVVRAPGRSVWTLLFREALRRSIHLAPYLSRTWCPFLRSVPELADPAVLAEETRRALKELRFKKKFFVIAYFSALHDPCPLTNHEALRGIASTYEGPVKYALPASPYLRRTLSPAHGERLRQLYRANVREVDGAVGGLLEDLRRLRLDENTYVVVWSPGGPVFLDGDLLRSPQNGAAPLIVAGPVGRVMPRRVAQPVRTQDVGPTVMRLLGLPWPEGTDGVSLIDMEFDDPTQDPLWVYAESDLWARSWDGPTPKTQRVPYPDLWTLLERPTQASAPLRLAERWEDFVLVAKGRMIQEGDERLVYLPTRDGVRFEYHDYAADPEGRRDFSRAADRRERLTAFKEEFYRLLSQEAGWRPQNSFWIPEAYLRQEEY